MSNFGHCHDPAHPTLTLLRHPHGEAPLQPAVLAAVPGDLVDDAVPVAVAGVNHVLLHAAAEEALRRQRRGGKRRGELNYSGDGSDGNNPTQHDGKYQTSYVNVLCLKYSFPSLKQHQPIH